MSKWTKWIPHTGDECPVDGNEIVRVKIRGRKFDKDFRTFRASGWGWRQITHYKRLKANVEPEIATAQLPPLSVSASGVVHSIYQPEPIITGPGEYKTRGGEKATVSSRVLGDWVGSLSVFSNIVSWAKDGAYCFAAHPEFDITGPWVEPEPKPEEPERWANLYCDDGEGLFLGVGRFPSKYDAKNKIYGPHPHIGTVLLNPEEE